MSGGAKSKRLAFAQPRSDIRHVARPGDFARQLV